jgi:hypothetical protein
MGNTDLQLVEMRVQSKNRKFEKEEYAGSLKSLYWKGLLHAELRGGDAEDQIYLLPSRLNHW